jgi:YfiH family protein
LSRGFSNPPRSHGLYHWVPEGEGHIDDRYLEVGVAGERALKHSSGDTLMLFGLGPAVGGELVEERCLRLLDALEPRVRALRWGHQVHGRLVASIASEAGCPLVGTACVGRCDALITGEAGLGLMVWTADCVPILLRGEGVIAAVHSGWRGTAVDIVGAVVRRFAVEFGVPAESLQADLGPAITGPRYEVGPEVIEALEAIGLNDHTWRRGRFVDLRQFLVARLRALGLLADSITVNGPCTASTASLASYRRDGAAAGRQFSLIYRELSGGDTAEGRARRPRS